MGKGHCDAVERVLNTARSDKELRDELAQLCETFFDEYDLGCSYADGEEVAEEMLRQEEEIQKLKGELDAERRATALSVSGHLEAQICCSELKQENRELKEELDVWVNPTGEVVMNREGMMLYEASQEEIKKLKGYLGEVGSVLDINIVEGSHPEVTTIHADAFDRLTNNEFV